ncbi:hypothetical protein [Acidianus sp. RZ1]|uniref:hypothetical protein n=1 Tax=Acidianus sp. RZ1 TaxID=1540082 RepID=UPI001492F57F|nr:hypothetical protein [Acidianus sp. RZ1]NON61144.1 hypothetical protein [Acidianus sp. RZ1]
MSQASEPESLMKKFNVREQDLIDALIECAEKASSDKNKEDCREYNKLFKEIQDFKESLKKGPIELSELSNPHLLSKFRGIYEKTVEINEIVGCVAQIECEKKVIKPLKKSNCGNIKSVYDRQRGKAWSIGTKELVKEIFGSGIKEDQLDEVYKILRGIYVNASSLFHGARSQISDDTFVLNFADNFLFLIYLAVKKKEKSITVKGLFKK